jgi:hypothetical protein
MKSKSLKDVQMEAVKKLPPEHRQLILQVSQEYWTSLLESYFLSGEFPTGPCLNLIEKYGRAKTKKSA